MPVTHAGHNSKDVLYPSGPTLSECKLRRNRPDNADYQQAQLYHIDCALIKPTWCHDQRAARFCMMTEPVMMQLTQAGRA